MTDLAVEVTVADLHLIKAALNSAYHHSTVLDLAEQYRKLQQRPTQSKMTIGLQNVVTLVETYITLADPPEGTDE